jgi:hypothetical protein
MELSFTSPIAGDVPIMITLAAKTTGDEARPDAKVA